jgi:thiol-disulfide isomerase/thioredoxin
MKMPRSRLYTILGLGFAVILVAAVLYVNNAGNVHAGGASPPAVLDKLKLVNGSPPAPDASFVDSGGNAVKLADFRGRYVLVNLWATWCGPCITELPALSRLNAELPQDRVTVLHRYAGEGGRAKLATFLSSRRRGLPVYVDRDFRCSGVLSLTSYR